MEKDEWKPGQCGMDMGQEERKSAEAPDVASEGKAEGTVPYMELYYLDEAAVTADREQEIAEHKADPEQPSAESAAEEETVPSADRSDAEEDTMNEDELNGIIEDLCHSKAQEFRMLGYEHVTGQEIWECVSDKYKKIAIPPLHRIVNDILSLKVTQFMNWMTMSIYKDNAHFR